MRSTPPPPRDFRRDFRGNPRESDRKNKINEEIKAPTVRVVDADGEMLGIMSSREARDLAQQREKDLVEIAPQANPPVCKIIDYGKFQYEQHKRDKMQKKQVHQSQLKEVRFKPHTDKHDFDFKTRHARGFLMDGDKVKASVMFRGREMQHTEFGNKMLKEFVAALDDIAKIDQAIKQEGRTMSVTLAPDKDKQKKIAKEKNPGSSDDE